MDAYSYLSVLNSIVLGLALTSLLSGFAVMVRARDRIRMYWPLAAQMALLFLLQVQMWWAMFSLRDIRHWSFAGFLVVLMEPVVAYLATAFLIPDVRDDEELDLRTAYFREARWFFAALLLVLVDSIAKNLVLYGNLPPRMDFAGHAAFAFLCMAGIVSRRDIVHKLIAPLALIVLAAYIAVLFASLPG